jgi:hypothetical protein
MYAPRQAGAGEANLGHPSRGEGFVLCSNRCAADELQLCRSNTGLPIFQSFSIFLKPTGNSSHDSRQARPCLEALFGLVRMNRDSAIYGFELERSAALADVRVDVIADLTLDRDWEAHRYAAVYCLRH